MNESAGKRVRSFRVEAVILRHSEWGEADRMLTLYTRELGKVGALAKGARKLRSRKAGHLEPFAQASLLLARGRDILLVTQADTLAAYSALRDNLMLTTYAAYVVELLDRFTYEEGENQALYQLLVDTLSRLEAVAQRAAGSQAAEPAPSGEAEPVVRYYEMRLLDLTGFRPQLFQCSGCGKAIEPEDQYFSAETGGALCPKCGELPGRSVRPVSLQALKYMRHYQRSSFREAARAQPAIITQREIESLMQYYLTYILERGLNTPAFLRRLRQEKKNA
jgi:DNA repair protein RecO (recombination protein O)